MFNITVDNSFIYLESIAKSSFDKNGKEIPEEGSAKRLELGDDTRFSVAVRVVNLNKWGDRLVDFFRKGRKYVQIKQGREKILIRIDALSQRLHLTVKEIRDVEKEGALHQLLPQQAEKMSVVIQGYEKIVNFFKTKSLETTLDPKTLMNVVKVAWMTKNNAYFPFKMKESVYHVGFDLSKKEIRLTTLGESFARGSFAEVRKWTNVIDQVGQVFKQARSDFGKSDRSSVTGKIKEEFNILSYLHNQGKVWGIQSKPKEVVYLQKDSEGPFKDEECGFIGESYQENYFELIHKKGKRPLESILLDVHQILSGLKHLHEKQVIHHDLKPENLLAKKDVDGTLLVHIADFAGACHYSKDTSADQLAGFHEFSAQYSLYKDLQLSYAFVELSKTEEEAREELIHLEKGRDIFSAGCIIYAAFTKRLPYRKYESDTDFPIVSSYSRMKRSDIPEDLIDIFESMLHLNYKKRPTAEDLFEQFQGYLAESHKDLYLKIQSKLEKEYPGTPLEPISDYLGDLQV